MFLTRLGENARMVVTGDLRQVDLPKGVPSGLHDAIDTLAGVDGVGFVRFSDADVVRHALVSRLVRAYAAQDRTEERRVGKRGVRTCSSRGSPYHKKKKK